MNIGYRATLVNRRACDAGRKYYRSHFGTKSTTFEHILTEYMKLVLNPDKHNEAQEAWSAVSWLAGTLDPIWETRMPDEFFKKIEYEARKFYDLGFGTYVNWIQVYAEIDYHIDWMAMIMRYYTGTDGLANFMFSRSGGDERFLSGILDSIDISIKAPLRRLVALIRKHITDEMLHGTFDFTEDTEEDEN